MRGTFWLSAAFGLLVLLLASPAAAEPCLAMTCAFCEEAISWSPPALSQASSADGDLASVDTTTPEAEEACEGSFDESGRWVPMCAPESASVVAPPALRESHFGRVEAGRSKGPSSGGHCAVSGDDDGRWTPGEPPEKDDPSKRMLDGALVPVMPALPARVDAAAPRPREALGGARGVRRSIERPPRG